MTEPQTPEPAPPPGTDPVLAGDAEAFYRALSGLLKVYQFRDRDRICCHDVSVTQCHALEEVVRRGPRTVNELAAALYLDKSTASRVVGALERKGYVERVPDPRDGRVRRVAATAAGTELSHRIAAEILAEETALLADFPPDVRRGMTTILERLTEAARDRVEASGGSCCRLPATGETRTG